jgi:hypothetical protein
VFVQLIRGTVKPDAWGKIEELFQRWQREQAPKAPGFKGEYLLRAKNLPNTFIAVVFFESEDLARQNSSRPETNEYYQEMLKLTDGQPEFIDAELLHSYLM